MLCVSFVKEHKWLFWVHTCERVFVHCVHPWTREELAGVARTTQRLSEIIKQLLQTGFLNSIVSARLVLSSPSGLTGLEQQLQTAGSKSYSAISWTAVLSSWSCVKKVSYSFAFFTGCCNFSSCWNEDSDKGNKGNSPYSHSNNNISLPRAELTNYGLSFTRSLFSKTGISMHAWVPLPAQDLHCRLHHLCSCYPGS